MRIAILGGGVAGLATAVALRRRGVAATVHERVERYAAAGFGFILLGNGLEALDWLGVGAALRAHAQPLDRVILRTQAGRILSEGPLADAWCITRHELLDRLREALPAEQVHTSAGFESFERDPARPEQAVAARLAEGQRVEADVFVGTDGIRSRVREALFGQARLSPVRIKELVCLAHAPAVCRELGTTFLKTYDERGGLALGLVPVGDDRLIAYVQYDSARRDFADPEQERDPGARAAFARAAVGDWPAPIPQVLEAIDYASGFVWHTTDLDPLPALVQGNVALAGDAGHAFLTFTSQGMNCALADAWALGDLLAGTGGDPARLPQALAEYDRQRGADIERYLKAGRELARRFLDLSVEGGALELPLVK